VSVLSCNENEFGFSTPVNVPVSLIVGVTPLNDPVALEMVRDPPTAPI
jgi:hypothetical protein